MSQEAKCRFTISLSQLVYDTLRNVAGPRGGGAYIEALLKKQFSNENNINSVVIRMDTLEHLINKMIALISIFYPDKVQAFKDSDDTKLIDVQKFIDDEDK